MQPERLVSMANQIADYFKYQRDTDVPKEIANHLRLFWDPRMRRAIIDYVAQTGGDGLEEPSLKAVELLSVEGDKNPEYLPSTAKCDASGGREDPG
jgi:formate dehydrogenase subunit delta